MKWIKRWGEPLHERTQLGLDNELWFSIRNKHFPGVLSSIRSGADVSSLGIGDEPPILWISTSYDFIEKDELQILKLLIRKGSPIDQSSKYSGATALQFICLKNNKRESVVKNIVDAAVSLIKAGAEINGKDRDGMTALHNAASHGNHLLVKKLVELGAEIDPENIYGETPLASLVRSWPDGSDYWEIYNSIPIAKFLIKAGANPYKAFKDLDFMKRFFEGKLQWYPGGEEALRRRFKATEIRKRMF